MAIIATARHGRRNDAVIEIRRQPGKTDWLTLVASVALRRGENVTGWLPGCRSAMTISATSVRRRHKRTVIYSGRHPCRRFMTFPAILCRLGMCAWLSGLIGAVMAGGTRLRQSDMTE